MSIASQLQALEGNIEDAYDMVAQRGGTMPQRKNMENLDDAIATIPSATTYSAGNGIDITGTTISIDDTVVAELTDIPGIMIGATSSAPGMGGTVPAPAAGDEDKVLTGAGTWSKVSSDNIVGGTSGDTLANGALVEVVGTTTGNSANYAWKYADGRLINFQHYTLSGNATTSWGSVYSGVQLVPRNYAVAFTAIPIVMAQLDWTSASGNCWLAQANEAGSATVDHPGGYQLVRPTSMSGLTTGASIVAYGFWK